MVHVLACLVLLFCAVLYKYRAKTLKGSVPMHKGHLPLIGSTHLAIMDRLRGKSAFVHFVYNQVQQNGYKSFAWSAVGGRMGVVILEKEDIKFALKDNFNNFVKAPGFLENFSGLLGQGIFNSNGDVWKQQRVVMAQMFNRRQLRERMSLVFGAHSQDLVDLLKKTELGEAVNIMPFFYHFTFDCINSVAFNRDVNSLGGNEKDVAFQKAFDVIQHGILGRFMIPWWKLYRFMQLSSERGIVKGLEVVNAYVEDVVDQYFEKDGSLKEDAIVDDRTMTGLFLDNARSSGIVYDRVFIRDMILNTVIAGRDSTGSALTSCIEYLCYHPEWQDKLHEEAKACFGGMQEALTFDDVEGVSPVAEAVFLEAIRLHPAVPANEKLCLEDTEFPSGVKVPAGVGVNWLPYVTNRYKKLWGDDAEEFNPERWMDGRTYDDFMHPSFNAGPRLCLGKSMAILEGKIALLTLFANFKFSMREGFVPRMKPSITWQLDSNGLEVLVHPV
eukprot:TRINITY_DN694_c7_g1_i1.p1 TRINITY_DN694_c7_g1~~TRINITY_DN694_c7_g1_i1.p1  ORF type:complete len:519 (+),score=157.92 TRINITY_DN694_c7_g1_i1:63-1559(+)